MNKEKPYVIKLENRNEYLYALVSGESLTPEIARMYWDEIAEMCLTLKKSKIMIEKQFAVSVSPPEMLEMGVYLGKILSGKKIAFLDQYVNESINELGKVIARNHGVILRIFENTEDAEKWLIGN
jgi:CheY-specific phosphatase CheX